MFDILNPPDRACPNPRPRPTRLRETAAQLAEAAVAKVRVQETKPFKNPRHEPDSAEVAAELFRWCSGRSCLQSA
jgi:hypothetical protein